MNIALLKWFSSKFSVSDLNVFFFFLVNFFLWIQHLFTYVMFVKLFLNSRQLLSCAVINPKQGWPDLPYYNSNHFNSCSPSCSIQGILLLQTKTLALNLHLCLPHLWSSSLPLALHFKLKCFSQNMPTIPPQHMPLPSHFILLCHLNHCFLQSQHLHLHL